MNHTQGLGNTAAMRQKDIRPAPAEIEYKGFKFLITDRPSDQNILAYIQIWEKLNMKEHKDIPIIKCPAGAKHVAIEELKKHRVSAVVRVCEPTYKVDELNGQGIEVFDLGYDDGTFPPNKIVEEWFKVLKKQFNDNPDCCVAVHCIAGLGRAPVMVALAIIELGLKYEEAVELIREKRRGAINAKQLAFLEKYRPKSRLKSKNGHKNSCCVQ